MDFANPIPFFEAVNHLASKGLLPTAMDSAGLKRIDAAIRRQSVFSAETTMTGYLDQIKATVESIVNPQQVLRDGATRTVTEGFNPATARAELRRALQEDYGYEPGEDIAGTIKDLSSDARLNLIVKTNTELAQGAGLMVQANDPDALDLYPAWELVRYEDREKPRDWEARWRIAASVCGDFRAAGALGNFGRMCALKSSGIWQALGDGEGGYDDTLGNPYPPFAFNSGMWCEDVSRDEAVEMELIGESDDAAPARFDLGSLFATP